MISHGAVIMYFFIIQEKEKEDKEKEKKNKY